MEKRSEKASVALEIRAWLESARTGLQAAGITAIDITPADQELPPIPPPGLPAPKP